MVLKSELPADLSPVVRLREYLPLVRELNHQRDPHALLAREGMLLAIAFEDKHSAADSDPCCLPT